MGSSVTHLVVLIAFALLIAGLALGNEGESDAEFDRLEVAAAQAAADARSIARVYFGIDPMADPPPERSISTDISEISNSLALFKGAVQSPDAQNMLSGKTLPETWEELSRARTVAEDARRSLEILETALNDAGVGPRRGEGIRGSRDAATAIADLVEHNRELQTRNLQLIGQLANLERRAGVTGKPPCWVTPDGRAEYTYKITITDEEFVVEPIWRRERDADLEQVGVPLSRETITYDDEGFSRAMYPFLAFGADSDPECRFFVQVIDGTGPFKGAWQERLALVEGYFYKFWLK